MTHTPQTLSMLAKFMDYLHIATAVTGTIPETHVKLLNGVFSGLSVAVQTGIGIFEALDAAITPVMTEPEKLPVHLPEPAPVPVAIPPAPPKTETATLPVPLSETSPMVD